MATTRYCAKCLTSFADDPPRCPNLACGGARPTNGWGDLLGPGDLLDRHYQIVRPLAVGGAGLTYLAREVDASGQAIPPDLAIKVLYAQRDAGPFLRRLANEAQILQELAHPHIVECRGFVHRAGHAPYLITLFEHGGSLSGHVDAHGPLSPRVSGAILRQILLALDTAHQRGVVHRDLKPENVLLAQPVAKDDVPHIKVTDFGIAKVQGGMAQKLTRAGAFVGTPEYAAPEQFAGQAPTPATDVFAAGALVFHLLAGHPPIHFTHRLDIEASHEELLQQLPPRLPAAPDATDERAVLQECIDAMMRPEAAERWTVQQVIARLQGQAVPPPRPLPRPSPSPASAALTPDHTLDLRSHETYAGEGWDQRRPGTVDSVPALRTEQREISPPPPPPPPPPTTWERTTPAPAAPALAPPKPAPPAPVEDAPPPRGGCLSTLLALVGSATSALLLIGATAAVCVVALVGAAWAFGWFGSPYPPPSVTLDPIPLHPPPPQR